MRAEAPVSLRDLGVKARLGKDFLKALKNNGLTAKNTSAKKN